MLRQSKEAMEMMRIMRHRMEDFTTAYWRGFYFYGWRDPPMRL